jgi:hypothetical protein
MKPRAFSIESRGWTEWEGSFLVNRSGARLILIQEKKKMAGTHCSTSILGFSMPQDNEKKNNESLKSFQWS